MLIPLIVNDYQLLTSTDQLISYHSDHVYKLAVTITHRQLFQSSANVSELQTPTTCAVAMAVVAVAWTVVVTSGFLDG